MRMGSGGAGSSYMSPQVRTGDNGQQTWEDYIKKYIESSITKDKIIKALLNGGDTISFGQNVTVTAETFNGHNMKKASADLATQHYVDNKVKEISPSNSSPTTP